jgi:hypothetical protein
LVHEVEPLDDEYEPGEHAVQEDEPLNDEYEPGEQAVHAIVPPVL